MDIENLILIPENFYNIKKYVRKYTNLNISVYHSTSNVSSSLINVSIEQAIRIIEDKDTQAVLVLQDFGKMLEQIDTELNRTISINELTETFIALERYYVNVRRILVSISHTVLYTIWQEMLLNDLSILD